MSDRRHDHAGPGLWIGLALGTPIMAWGVRGILDEAARTHPGELGRWIVGSALVHDLVLLPAVLAVAVVVRRVVPPLAWPAVRWGLITSGVVLLVSWPFVAGYGKRAGNPSLLPRDYGEGVAVCLLVVWLVVAALVLTGAARDRRRTQRRAAGRPSVDDSLEHRRP